MDDFNEGFGQSTHLKRAAQMGFLPRTVLDTDTTDSGGTGSGDAIDLGWVSDTSFGTPTVRRIPEYTPPTADRSTSIPDITQPDERGGSFTVVDTVGGESPPAPGTSTSPSEPLPEAPEVVPTSAAFSDALACFIYTVGPVPDRLGTAGLPGNGGSTCAALIFQSADDDWDGELSDTMRAMLYSAATHAAPGTTWQSDFDALRYLANQGVVLVGPAFCNAEQVLLSYMGPTATPEDYYVEDEVSGGEGEGEGNGLMTGLIVAGAIAAYYLIAEKG